MTTTSEQDVALHEFVGKLPADEKWMLAMWIVEDGKLVLVHRITNQFPTGDFLPAIGLLATNCHEEAMSCRNKLPSDPLPQAKVFRMPCEAEEVNESPLHAEKWQSGEPLPTELVGLEDSPNIDEPIITEVLGSDVFTENTDVVDSGKKTENENGKAK